MGLSAVSLDMLTTESRLGGILSLARSSFRASSKLLIFFFHSSRAVGHGRRERWQSRMVINFKGSDRGEVDVTANSTFRKLLRVRFVTSFGGQLNGQKNKNV